MVLNFNFYTLFYFTSILFILSWKQTLCRVQNGNID